MDILGVYDVSLSETAESIVLTFDVGEEYDGKDITVLHYKEVDDVTYMETYVCLLYTSYQYGFNRKYTKILLSCVIIIKSPFIKG